LAVWARLPQSLGAKVRNLEWFDAHHWALQIKDRYYDAECLWGVEDLWRLPFYEGVERTGAEIEASLG
jgi:hypothetical protein